MCSARLDCKDCLHYQAISLKFRLLSIQFTSEAFETGRKMSVMGDLSPTIPQRGTRHAAQLSSRGNRAWDQSCVSHLETFTAYTLRTTLYSC